MKRSGRSAVRPFKGMHGRLVDEAFQRYLDWCDEAAALDAAYRRWTKAPRGERRLAFAAYSAALEREELASAQYQTLLEAAEQMLTTP